MLRKKNKGLFAKTEHCQLLFIFILNHFLSNVTLILTRKKKIYAYIYTVHTVLQIMNIDCNCEIKDTGGYKQLANQYAMHATVA